MVLRLAGQLAEHLVDTDAAARHAVELERLVHTLPAGPYQRDRGPSQWLLRMLATQTERTELVPLIDALHARMRAEKVMDFGMQMASAARLASTFPQVGEQLRQRYRVVLLDEYQDTGHAQRDRAVVAVRRRRRRRPRADRRRRPDPVDLRLARRVGDQPAAVHHRLPADRTAAPAPTLELRTSWRNPPRALHLANAVSAEARRTVRRGAGAAAATRRRSRATIRCALLADVAAERDWVADHIARPLPRRPRRDGDAAPTAAVLVRRNADAAPMADALARARRAGRGRRARPGCSPCPRSPTWWRCCGWWPTRPPAPRRCGCSPGRGGGWVAATSPRCGDARSSSTTRPTDATAHRPSEIVAQAAADADAACLADAISDPGPADCVLRGRVTGGSPRWPAS